MTPEPTQFIIINHTLQIVEYSVILLNEKWKMPHLGGDRESAWNYEEWDGYILVHREIKPLVQLVLQRRFVEPIRPHAALYK